MDKFEVELDDDGKIIDFLDGNPLVAGPEEFVRQKYLRILEEKWGQTRLIPC